MSRIQTLAKCPACACTYVGRANEFRHRWNTRTELLFPYDVSEWRLKAFYDKLVFLLYQDSVSGTNTGRICFVKLKFVPKQNKTTFVENAKILYTVWWYVLFEFCQWVLKSVIHVYLMLHLRFHCLGSPHRTWTSETWDRQATWKWGIYKCNNGTKLVELVFVQCYIHRNI